MASLHPGRRAVRWIIDWDGTLTTRDTLDALVRIAASTKPDSHVLQQWERVTQAYVGDYEVTLKSQTPDGKLPDTIAQEARLLTVLRDVEERSINRVSESGIFSGLTGSQLDSGAANAINTGQVQLRDGCCEFLKYVRRHDVGMLNILSVNWSRQFIAACLNATEPGLAELFKNHIYANELQGIKNGKPSTGRIGEDGDLRLISSHDKVTCQQQLRTSNSERESAIPVVYIGDSWTDFECLLEADLGICIRDDPMTSTQKKLGDSLRRLGVRCPHIQDWREVDKWGVVWVKSFGEIERWQKESKMAMAKFAHGSISIT